jgi:hypothetical protein
VPRLTGPAVQRRVRVQWVENTSPGVLTYHNDWGRTGQNLHETLLTPDTVNPRQFGLLKTNFQVDGPVLGQPLYVPNVTINGTAYNIVLVATEQDSVYAFDADVDRHPQNWASPLWVRSLLNPGEGPVPAVDQRDGNGVMCNSGLGVIGITSTPVVDPTTGTLYVVARTKDANGNYGFALHALDLASGLEKTGLGAPARIGAPDFDALRANQRAGLALAGGIVYVGFASYCDQLPFHGWLFGYDTENQLAQVVAFNTTPGDFYGGIWGAGAAPAVDTDGSLLLSIGNGRYDPLRNLWGESVLKLGVERSEIKQIGMQVLDHFAPMAQDFLAVNDLDFGSGGMMLLPRQPGAHPYLAVGGGKQGLIYVLNRDRLTTSNRHHTECSDAALQSLAAANSDHGGDVWTDTCDPVLQTIKNTVGRTSDATLPSAYIGPALFTTPTYWNGRVYIGAHRDNVKMFTVTEGALVNRPVSMSANTFARGGVNTSISANGDQNGILWALDSGESNGTSAILYAYDARDLSRVLYKSSGSIQDEQAGVTAPGGRDLMNVGRRFAVPTVYGGKVFVATGATLHVFGLR